VRVAVLSDIHANLAALDAVLAAIGTVDAIWHLGDVVGYGSEPDAVVGRLAEHGATGVAGNHDLAALGGNEIDWFNPEARAAMEWTRRRIDGATRDWLGALPTTRLEDGVTLVHGSPRDPVWEYVTSAPLARTSLDLMETPLGLHGHTHVPIAWIERAGRVESITPAADTRVAVEGRRALLNPGSVGQPRDGDPTASWLELDTAGGTATWRRVAYDIAAARAGIIDAGLPPRLGDRLRHGL
jgi:diadenosine tetraphosphatase ApaH/serine/threonine PP2A family protein phosphatase